jgi:hypothetical protein
MPAARSALFAQVAQVDRVAPHAGEWSALPSFVDRMRRAMIGLKCRIGLEANGRRARTSRAKM